MNYQISACAVRQRPSLRTITGPRVRCIAVVVLGLAAAGVGLQRVVVAAPPADEDPAYTRVINQRADKIVAQLDISDPAKATQVRDLIADQYRHLGAIHDGLDARIAEAKKSPAPNSAAADAWTKVAQDQASLELFGLHRQFVSRLAAELTPAQVDTVKDGMTYGVLQITYKAYQDMLPNLTDQQKTVILANLIEAREYAMDGGSSKQKHGWFGKYKGRINNYLSAAGYDLKQAEKDWAAQRKAAQRNRP